MTLTNAHACAHTQLQLVIDHSKITVPGKNAADENKHMYMLIKCVGTLSQTHHFLSSILIIFHI